MKDAKESKSLGKVENLIDAWVEMWNSYDFLQKGKKVFALPICILPITNRWNPGGLNFDEIRGQASSPKMPSITLD